MRLLILTIAIAVGAVLYSRRNSPTEVYTLDVNSLKGKTIIVTGGTTGLGLETVKRLAVGGARVILTSRSATKGEAAVSKTMDYLKEKGVENSDVSYKVLELTSLKSVKNAATWDDISSIDVLVNNAGQGQKKYEVTEDGFEQTFQTNHLSHFALTAVLSPKFSETARIINVSSELHAALDFDKIWNTEPEKYRGGKAYQYSKMANILFTEELERRILSARKRWKTASVHPGRVRTDILRHLFGAENFEKVKAGSGSFALQALQFMINIFFDRTVDLGANVQVWLASDAADETLKGDYYVGINEIGRQKITVEGDPIALRLWKESEENSGLKFTI